MLYRQIPRIIYSTGVKNFTFMPTTLGWKKIRLSLVELTACLSQTLRRWIFRLYWNQWFLLRSLYRYVAHLLFKLAFQMSLQTFIEATIPSHIMTCYNSNNMTNLILYILCLTRSFFPFFGYKTGNQVVVLRMCSLYHYKARQTEIYLFSRSMPEAS